MAFCGNCGTQLINGVKFCPNCGKERDTTDNFCAKCCYPFYQQSTLQKPKEDNNDDFSFFGFLWKD